MKNNDFIKIKFTNKITIISAVLLFILSALFWILYGVLNNTLFMSLATGLTASFAVAVFFELAKINDKAKKRKLLFATFFHSLKSFEAELKHLLFELNDGTEFDIYYDATKTKDLIKESRIEEVKKKLFELDCHTIYEVFSDFQDNRLQLLLNDLINQNEFILFGEYTLSINNYFEIIKQGITKSFYNSNSDEVNKSILHAFYILSDCRKTKGFSGSAKYKI